MIGNDVQYQSSFFAGSSLLRTGEFQCISHILSHCRKSINILSYSDGWSYGLTDFVVEAAEVLAFRPGLVFLSSGLSTRED